MLIWIRALLSVAVEIKTLEGGEMLVGLISPPVTDWGIKAIFMAFWSAFSQKKEWGHLLERIHYTSRYPITQELLQLLDEFSFSYLFPLFFDRHPQLVCERVK